MTVSFRSGLLDQDDAVLMPTQLLWSQLPAYVEYVDALNLAEKAMLEAAHAAARLKGVYVLAAERAADKVAAEKAAAGANNSSGDNSGVEEMVQEDKVDQVCVDLDSSVAEGARTAIDDWREENARFVASSLLWAGSLFVLVLVTVKFPTALKPAELVTIVIGVVSTAWLPEPVLIGGTKLSKYNGICKALDLPGDIDPEIFTVPNIVYQRGRPYKHLEPGPVAFLWLLLMKAFRR